MPACSVSGCHCTAAAPLRGPLYAPAACSVAGPHLHQPNCLLLFPPALQGRVGAQGLRSGVGVGVSRPGPARARGRPRAQPSSRQRIRLADGWVPYLPTSTTWGWAGLDWAGCWRQHTAPDAGDAGWGGVDGPLSRFQAQPLTAPLRAPRLRAAAVTPPAGSSPVLSFGSPATTLDSTPSPEKPLLLQQQAQRKQAAERRPPQPPQRGQQ